MIYSNASAFVLRFSANHDSAATDSPSGISVQPWTLRRGHSFSHFKVAVAGHQQVLLHRFGRPPLRVVRIPDIPVRSAENA